MFDKNNYTKIINIDDGVVGDELNGVYMYGVYYIGINCLEYVIDCFNKNKQLIGVFSYKKHKTSVENNMRDIVSCIHCNYNNYTKEITLSFDGKINYDVL